MQKEFIEIKQLYRNKEQYIDKTVKVAGWIRTSRMSKNFGFIELNDGSFFKNMQIVIDEKLENFKEIGKKQAAGYLMGQVMKASKGQANPQIAKKMIDDKLAILV